MPHLPASEALSHIRVIDLTRVRSGPTAVRQLADWGADVIKVEAPESLEPDGALGASRHTSDFQNLHRNKRSITLNLKEPKAIEILMKLVETSDVVVENFRPDVKDRLGINYDKLKKRNPKIILASISGFGQDGPYAKRPGFDQIAQGMGGLMSITGAPGGANEGRHSSCRPYRRPFLCYGNSDSTSRKTKVRCRSMGKHILTSSANFYA